MQNSFLQLRQLHIQRLLLEAHDDFDDADENVEARHTAKITRLARAEQDEHLWKVDLQIRVKRKRDRTPPPYRVEVDMSGVFEARQDSQDPLQYARAIGVNGASILYSAAREHVYLLTSRARWGGFQLPVVSFADLKVTAVDGVPTPVD